MHFHSRGNRPTRTIRPRAIRDHRRSQQQRQYASVFGRGRAAERKSLSLRPCNVPRSSARADVTVVAGPTSRNARHATWNVHDDGRRGERRIRASVGRMYACVRNNGVRPDTVSARTRWRLYAGTQLARPSPLTTRVRIVVTHDTNYTHTFIPRSFRVIGPDERRPYTQVELE